MAVNKQHLTADCVMPCLEHIGPADWGLRRVIASEGQSVHGLPCTGWMDGRRLTKCPVAGDSDTKVAPGEHRVGDVDPPHVRAVSGWGGGHGGLKEYREAAWEAAQQGA